MKEYVIRKVDKRPENWDGFEKAKIDTFSWMDNGYAPRVEAALCYDSEAIYVKFWAYEKEIRCVHHAHGENVYEDSCVEFFLRPTSDPRYLNLETNALGYMLIGLGTESEGRQDILAKDEEMQFETSVKDAESYQDDMWTLSYRVPFSFLARYYPGVNVVEEGLRGNLLKCGDFTKYEHYGMWSPVENETPQFHIPEFFGKFTFEK